MEIANLLSKVSDTMHVSRCFGPASEHDGVTIVPVAFVAGGGGGGGSTEPVEPSPDAVDAEPSASVTGAGGGFGGVSWPLGVYVIQNGQVRWVPALDVTRLAIAVISVVKLVAKLRAARALRKG
jgi:uncharacterized spore protein YtfJ